MSWIPIVWTIWYLWSLQDTTALRVYRLDHPPESGIWESKQSAYRIWHAFQYAKTISLKITHSSPLTQCIQPRMHQFSANPPGIYTNELPYPFSNHIPKSTIVQHWVVNTNIGNLNRLDLSLSTRHSDCDLSHSIEALLCWKHALLSPRRQDTLIYDMFTRVTCPRSRRTCVNVCVRWCVFVVFSRFFSVSV